MTATNIFATDNSQVFSFSINDFLSPPTNEPVDALTISSQLNGFDIDTCQVYISDLTPKTLTTIALASSSGSSMVVNTFYTIRFTFTLADTLSQTDYLTVVFPASTTMSFSTSTINSNFGVNASSSTYSSSTYTLTLRMINQGRTFGEGTSLQFTVGSYQAPPSIQPTSDFTLTIWKNGY